MEKLKRTFSLLAPAALVLAASAIAFASEGGEEQGGANIMATVWQVINFGLLVAILVYGVRKADLKGMLRKRSDDIRKGIEEARQAREMAEKALAEVEARLKLKDKEMQEIIETARSSGERERAAIEEEGKKMSEKILAQARSNIQVELDQARAAIRAEAVELALELAAKKIGERLTPDEQKRLIEESLAKLEAGK